MEGEKRYLTADFDGISPVRCPCGSARRAFAGPGNTTATLHRVDISEDSRQIYFVLEGEGVVELDGEKVPVKPGSAVMIKPGCRHRAAGKLKILNIVVPPFDPEDEWLD
jgi:mannose-6-phosphate isomerase-like protein (cupin superfamily)